MRLTPALYVRQLLAKLNPSFPHTAQESQKLLNVLNTSFRKHLDETHPAPSQGTESDDATHRSIPLHSLHSSSVATQHHLNSLLTHPFWTTKGTSHTDFSHRKNAIERYQEAFVKGNITIDLLQSCVEEYIDGIRKHERIPQDGRLGPRLATWLQSTTKEMKEAFFLDFPLFRSVMIIMAADHEEISLWNWLRLVYERDFGTPDSLASDLTNSKWLAVEDHLVSTLMRFSIQRKDLNDAAYQFVEACKYRLQSGRINAEHGPNASNSASATLMSSWKRLAVSITVLGRSHGILPELYDAVLGHAPPWTMSPIFNDLMLTIYHPSNPSAQLLCMNLRQSVGRTNFVQTVRELGKNMALATLVTILDGAELSLKHNLISDAKLLLDFASENYGDYVQANGRKRDVASEERFKSIWQQLGPLEVKLGQLSVT